MKWSRTQKNGARSGRKMPSTHAHATVGLRLTVAAADENEGELILIQPKK